MKCGLASTHFPFELIPLSIKLHLRRSVDGTIDAHRAYQMTYNSHFDEVVLVRMWAEPGTPIGTCKLKLMRAWRSDVIFGCVRPAGMVSESQRLWPLEPRELKPICKSCTPSVSLTSQEPCRFVNTPLEETKATRLSHHNVITRTKTTLSSCFPSLIAAIIITIATPSISPACGMSVGHVLPTETILLQGGALCCLVNNDTNNRINNHTIKHTHSSQWVPSPSWPAVFFFLEPEKQSDEMSLLVPRALSSLFWYARSCRTSRKSAPYRKRRGGGLIYCSLWRQIFTCLL